jgi:tRNA-splicing endonuclease subunit Sen2
MDANKGQKRQSRLDNERIYGQPLPRVTPKNWVFNILSLLYPFSTSTPNADDLVTGVLDAPSRSVWVFDQEQQMVLWRKGFFGKGNLSRSEPTWLKREINRLQVEKKGGKGALTSHSCDLI